ncbi:MAG: type II toxin-antitoxin system Phd/YefM family antitoxin [Vicinamibacterales bacterium]
MVTRIIGVTELQRRFRAIFDEVREERVPYVLTRGSRPEAVLLPYEEYERLERLDEREVVYRFDRLLDRTRRHSEDTGQEDVLADVRRARDEARRR